MADPLKIINSQAERRNWKAICISLVIICFVLSMIAVWVTLLSLAECNEICTTDYKHYTELGCKAIIEEGQCCPSRYECPDVADRDNSKCYYQGMVYDLDREIPSEDIEGGCTVSCRCTSGFDNNTRFTCAHIDCAEFFTGAPEPNCVRQYRRESCCSTNKICGKQKEKLAICYVEGDRYLEGQRIYPKKHPCHACICQKQFDNSTIVDNQYCWEIMCNIEIYNADKLREGCIPVYFGNSSCCPISWKCPSDKDEIRRNENTIIVSDNKALKCQFGKFTMNVGDVIVNSITDEKCTTCQCLVPPMAHCVKDPKC